MLRRREKGKYKAEITVEMSIVLPVVLMLLCLTIQAGIWLHQKVSEETKSLHEKTREVMEKDDTAGYLRNCRIIIEQLENLKQR